MAFATSSAPMRSKATFTYDVHTEGEGVRQKLVRGTYKFRDHDSDKEVRVKTSEHFVDATCECPPPILK